MSRPEVTMKLHPDSSTYNIYVYIYMYIIYISTIYIIYIYPNIKSHIPMISFIYHHGGFLAKNHQITKVTSQGLRKILGIHPSPSPALAPASTFSKMRSTLANSARFRQPEISRSQPRATGGNERGTALGARLEHVSIVNRSSIEIDIVFKSF